jgi:hypothetical protein
MQNAGKRWNGISLMNKLEIEVFKLITDTVKLDCLS